MHGPHQGAQKSTSTGTGDWTMQGMSQLIKLVAHLRGQGPDPNEKHDPIAAEKELAEAILRERGEKA